MEEHNLPPGFRFHPTDEELITYYLARKISDYSFFARAIADVDLNKCEPWDLPGKASMGEKEWYFFSLRDRKYPTGLRTNRATEAGYWKTTGKDKEIFHFGALVGMKKTLVFYKGRAPKGEKTNWVMHEYRHQTKFPYKPAKEEWVVCRVFKKCTHVKKPQPSSSSLVDSPYDAASLSELGDDHVSILNNYVNPSAASSSALQTNENNAYTNNKVDMNLYLNWVLAREASNQSSFPWQSVLASSYGSAHAALAFNGYQAPEASDVVSGLNLFVGNGDGTFEAGSKMAFPGSSSKPSDQAQQQVFGQESIW